eukprot:4168604-Pyramimonas_sp.AAC.1
MNCGARRRAALLFAAHCTALIVDASNRRTTPDWALARVSLDCGARTVRRLSRLRFGGPPGADSGPR